MELNTTPMKLSALKNQMLFTFLEEISGGAFRHYGSSKILLLEGNEKNVDYCRWVYLTDVGPDVTDFKTGDIVMLESLKWTNEAIHENRSHWVTTDDSVIAVLEDDMEPPREIKEAVERLRG